MIVNNKIRSQASIPTVQGYRNYFKQKNNYLRLEQLKKKAIVTPSQVSFRHNQYEYAPEDSTTSFEWDKPVDKNLARKKKHCKIRVSPFYQSWPYLLQG